MLSWLQGLEWEMCIRDRIKELIHDKEQVEKEKYQEELHTLQSQMNPHFLMNTLNTLKFMAISAHYTGMQDMVVALENILAAVLNRDGGFYTCLLYTSQFFQFRYGFRRLLPSHLV